MPPAMSSRSCVKAADADCWLIAPSGGSSAAAIRRNRATAMWNLARAIIAARSFSVLGEWS